MRFEIDALESNLMAELRAQCAAVERDYVTALETARGELEHLQATFDGSGGGSRDGEGGAEGHGPRPGPWPGPGSGPGRGTRRGAGMGLTGFAEGDEEVWQKACWRAESLSDATDCTLDKLLGLKAYNVHWDAARVQHALSLLRQLSGAALLKRLLSFNIQYSVNSYFMSVYMRANAEKF